MLRHLAIGAVISVVVVSPLQAVEVCGLKFETTAPLNSAELADGRLRAEGAELKLRQMSFDGTEERFVAIANTLIGDGNLRNQLVKEVKGGVAQNSLFVASIVDTPAGSAKVQYGYLERAEGNNRRRYYMLVIAINNCAFAVVNRRNPDRFDNADGGWSDTAKAIFAAFKPR